MPAELRARTLEEPAASPAAPPPGGTEGGRSGMPSPGGPSGPSSPAGRAGRPLVGLLLAALVGLVVEGVVAGGVLVLLLRLGITPVGLWPITVAVGAFVGAETAARFGGRRWAGGLLATLPLLLVTTLLALRAGLPDVGLGGRLLVLGAVLVTNTPFAVLGIWLAGVRARWAAGKALTDSAGPAVRASGRRPRSDIAGMRPLG